MFRPKNNRKEASMPRALGKRRTVWPWLAIAVVVIVVVVVVVLVVR